MNIRTLRKRFPKWKWEYVSEPAWTCYFGTRGADCVRVEPSCHPSGVWIVTKRSGESMLGDWDGEP